MCGRYQAWVEDDALVEILEMEKQGAAERYLRQAEVFPGTVQPLLYGSLVRVRAHLSLWGVSLAPWGKKGTLINARAETAAEEGSSISRAPRTRGEPSASVMWCFTPSRHSK